MFIEGSRTTFARMQARGSTRKEANSADFHWIQKTTSLTMSTIYRTEYYACRRQPDNQNICWDADKRIHQKGSKHRWLLLNTENYFTKLMSSIYKTETAIVSPAREAAFMQKCTTIKCWWHTVEFRWYIKSQFITSIYCSETQKKKLRDISWQPVGFKPKKRLKADWLFHICH